MGFLSKDHTVHLIDLLKLIIVSLGVGSGIYIISDAAGWIMVMAAFFVWAITVLEIYQQFQRDRKAKTTETTKK